MTVDAGDDGADDRQIDTVVGMDGGLIGRTKRMGATLTSLASPKSRLATTLACNSMHRYDRGDRRLTKISGVVFVVEKLKKNVRFFQDLVPTLRQERVRAPFARTACYAAGLDEYDTVRHANAANRCC